MAPLWHLHWKAHRSPQVSTGHRASQKVPVYPAGHLHSPLLVHTPPCSHMQVWAHEEENILISYLEVNGGERVMPDTEFINDFLESDFIIKIYLYENDRINPNWYWLCMRLYGIPGCSSARRCQAGRPGSMLDRSDLVGTGTGRSQGHRHPRWNTCISLKKINLSLLSPHRALTYQHRYYIKLHVIINLVLLYLFYFIIFILSSCCNFLFMSDFVIITLLHTHLFTIDAIMASMAPSSALPSPQPRRAKAFARDRVAQGWARTLTLFPALLAPLTLQAVCGESDRRLVKGGRAGCLVGPRLIFHLSFSLFFGY